MTGAMASTSVGTGAYKITTNAMQHITRRAVSALAGAPAAAIKNTEVFTRFGDPKPAPHTHAAVVSSLAPTQVTVLESGLRVATERVPHALSATVGVWIDAGSRYESAATNGTAHFLEHLAFKGTKSRTQYDLEKEIEYRGAHLNAYTTREQTCYYAKVLKGDVGYGMEVLGDILQHSTLDAGAVERERGTILREMEEVEKMPEEMLFDHLHATAFQHSPLGRTILGPAENIRSITRDYLADYVAQHYTAPRMVIVGTGAVDHAELVKFAEKNFGGLPTHPTTAAELVRAEPAKFTGSEVRVRDDDMPALNFAIGVQGASWKDPDSIVLQVMQTIIGSWSKNTIVGANSGSELAQVAAANGLCSSFSAFSTNYHDTGLFGVSAVAEPGSDLEDLSWAICDAMTSMAYNVREDAILRAKNQLKSNILMSMEGTTATAEEIGRQLLVYGRRISPAEMFARIDAVDAAAIKRVANRFIKDNDIVLASIGPSQDLPDYSWLRRRTYWLTY